MQYFLVQGIKSMHTSFIYNEIYRVLPYHFRILPNIGFPFRTKGSILFQKDEKAFDRIFFRGIFSGIQRGDQLLFHILFRILFHKDFQICFHKLFWALFRNKLKNKLQRISYVFGGINLVSFLWTFSIVCWMVVCVKIGWSQIDPENNPIEITDCWIPLPSGLRCMLLDGRNKEKDRSR